MLLSAALLTILTTGQADTLAAGFVNPPASARPHTWWHWMDGNVTKEGITADLEAMKQAGIGGAQMFTVAQGIPKGPVDYMSPLWREMTLHAVKEAGRLGIELCIHNCAGWSSSGGPWVKPEDAMQTLAWSSVARQGPRRIDETLPPIKAPQVFAAVDYRKDIAVYAFKTPAPGAPVGEVLVLTDRSENGRLVWDMPAGEWTILRMGHVPTGKDNHPAPPEGDGLEVDKMSRAALRRFWDDGTMAAVIKDAGSLAGKVLNNALVDSYEVGNQNWTPLMREEFIKRRGYDPLTWLPVVAGVTVSSKAESDRFMWDWRRTIADLFADNYFGYFGELCRKNGLLFSTEPYGGPFDSIQVGGKADIPMGEFWLGGGTLETTKIASSTGHVYGLPVIGAESFTADEGRGKWLEEPYTAKALGDLVFTNGVNRYIFHRYAHQPWMDKFPGMTMGPWGTHLERTQTWWTEAKQWLRYVARCQYLLQKGKFVADALYFYGEGAPVDLPYRPNLQPRMPTGYDYDGCDANVVMNRLRVVNGMLVLPDGMKYRVLVLPESTSMTPQMAAKIGQFVQDGATVVGPKPTGSPSLVDYPACDGKVKQLGDAVWGDTKVGKQRVHGKGKVVWGKTLQEVFTDLGVAPDFEYRSLSSGSKLVYIHRVIDGAEVYFVSNQQYRPTEVEMTFRVGGKAPELWRADTGVIEDAPVYSKVGARTVLPMRLGPAESVFVVFRRNEGRNHLVSFGPAAPPGKPLRMPVVVIKLARYETADGRGADVTATVAQLVKEGQYEVPATNGTFGDPVVNVVKRLRVVYTVDGKEQTRTVAENETLYLFDLPNTPVEPASYEVSVSGGETYLTAWKAGKYTGRSSGGRSVSTTVERSADEVKIAGPWRLDFTPGWGAPPTLTLPQLASWSEHVNTGVKYFSGSAVYTKSFTVPTTMLGSDRTIVLDLGRVKNFATVTLNGRDLGVLWKEPFTVNVTRAVKAGANELKVKVTNLWPNRIIGDEQLPPDVEWNGVTLKGWPEWLVKNEPRPKTGRYTFTTWKYWNKDSALLESGLLGPVVVRSARRIELRP